MHIYDLKYYSRYFTIPYRFIFAIYCLMIVQRGRLYNKIYNNNVLIFVYIYYLLFVLRILYDGFLSDKYMGTPWSVYLFKFLSFVVIPSIAFTAILNKESVKKAMDGVKYSCIIFLILGILVYKDKVVGDYRSLMYAEDVVSNELISPMIFSYIGFSLMGIVVWEMLYEKGGIKIGNIIFLFLALYGMFYGGTRNVFVAIPILFIYLFAQKAKTVKIFWYVSIFTILFLIAVFLVNNLIGSGVMNRFDILYNEISRGDSDAGSMRLYIWDHGLSEFMKSPFFGSGIEVDVVKFVAHNMYLESLMSTGIVGGGLFILIIIITLYNGRELLKKNTGLGWIVVLFVERLITGMMSTSIFDPLFWLPVVAINANSRKIK